MRRWQSWSIASACRADAFGLRWFESITAHQSKGVSMNKILGISQAKNMIQLDENIKGEKEVWLWLSLKSQQFIDRFKVGQEIEYDADEKDGKKTINFMKVKGTVSSVNNSSKSIDAQEGYVCADCGAKLKDNSYETCYKCSMIRREKENTSPEGMDKQKSIRAQAIGNMVSRSLISLQGTFDINNIGTVIDSLYEHYERNILKLESK